MRKLEDDAEEFWNIMREARGCIRGGYFAEAEHLVRALDRLRTDTGHAPIAIRAQQGLIDLQQQAIDKERAGMFPIGTPVLVKQMLPGGTVSWLKAHVAGHNMLAGTCLVSIDGHKNVKAVPARNIIARDENTGSAA